MFFRKVSILATVSSVLASPLNATIQPLEEKYPVSQDFFTQNVDTLICKDQSVALSLWEILPEIEESGLDSVLNTLSKNRVCFEGSFTITTSSKESYEYKLNQWFQDGALAVPSYIFVDIHTVFVSAGDYVYAIYPNESWSK